jgi:hypothetical protein
MHNPNGVQLPADINAMLCHFIFAAPPTGRCFNTSDCGSADLLCDATSDATNPVTKVCNCTGGEDTCRDAYTCKRTPCAVCRCCLSEWHSVMASQQDAVNAEVVGLAFSTRCLSSGRSSSMCQQVQQLIASSTAGSAGKRPGMLCTALNECSSTIRPDCALSSNTSAAVIPAGQLDLCTASGTSGGATLATYRAATGCGSDSDCNSTSLFCDMAGTVARQCSCNTTSGAESCLTLVRD